MTSATYFAYGSNLDEAQMAHRCPGARVVSPGWLFGYELMFSGYCMLWQGAVATVVPSPGNVVPGLLWHVTQHDNRALDAYEGWPDLYQRKSVTIGRLNQHSLGAFTYFIPRQLIVSACPSDLYLDVMLAAYRKWGFGVSALLRQQDD